MLVVIGEDREKVESEAVQIDIYIDSIETLYLEFERLKTMTGTENIVMIRPNYIELVSRFPFDLVFLVGAPNSDNPATYLSSVDFKTVDWTSYLNHLTVKKTNESPDFIEEYSNSDE